jgi:hypothetical protein
MVYLIGTSTYYQPGRAPTVNRRRMMAPLAAVLLAAAAAAAPPPPPPPPVCPGFHVVHGQGLASGSKGTVLSGIPTVGDCCDRCAANSTGCKAWSFHPKGTHSELQCHLLVNAGAPHASKGTISGSLSPITPTPPPPPPGPSPSKPPLPPPLPPAGKPVPPLGFQPNIVFIITDDQDVEIGGLEPMPKLKRLVGDAGATFRHFYINTPVCCPSRSEYLSGRFHHNIRDDRYETEPGGKACGGDEAVGKAHPCGCMHVNSTTAEFEAFTYANYMQQAGYTTGYFGKYLNPPSMDIYCRVPGSHFPGWDAFMGMCNTAYYDVNWNDGGNLTFTGSTPKEYSTSIVGNRTIDFIREAATAKPFKPFLAVAATRAPHGPETPAPWYKNALGHAKNMRTPAWNYSAVGHVPWVADLPPLSAREASSFDNAYRNRWRTLLSVDDIVEAVVDVLTEMKLLEKTYVFYSSDHGFHLGHMRLGAGACRTPLSLSFARCDFLMETQSTCQDRLGTH